MGKVARTGLLVFAVFLSFDSFGLASLAHTWLSVRFSPTYDHPSISRGLFVEKMESRSSLNDLFNYKSLRRIQTSA
jgi:hypothetical protein